MMIRQVRGKRMLPKNSRLCKIVTKKVHHFKKHTCIQKFRGFPYPGLSVKTATPIGAISHPNAVTSNQNALASSDAKLCSLNVAAAAAAAEDDADDDASDCWWREAAIKRLSGVRGSKQQYVHIINESGEQ